MEEFEIKLEPGMYLVCKAIQQMILDNPEISEKLYNIIPWLEN